MDGIIDEHGSPMSDNLEVVSQEKTKLFSFEEKNGEDIFTFNSLSKKAAEKAEKEGRTVKKHANGKINIASIIDDPKSITNVCPYCEMTFIHKFVLSRHIKQIHEKHKLTSFQCPKCDYSTVRKEQMRCHYSVVHENFKPFCCSLCNFRAPKAFRVTTHQKNCHNGQGVVIHDKEMKPRPVSPSVANAEVPKKPKKKTRSGTRKSTDKRGALPLSDPYLLLGQKDPSFLGDVSLMRGPNVASGTYSSGAFRQQDSSTSQFLKRVVTASRGDVVDVLQDPQPSSSSSSTGGIKIVKPNGEIVQVISSGRNSKAKNSLIIENQVGPETHTNGGQPTTIVKREEDEDVEMIKPDFPPQEMDVSQIPLNPAWKGYQHLFKCCMCPYKTTDQIQFAQHLISDHDQSKDTTLGQRLKLTHSTTKRIFPCHRCKIEFKALPILYQHLKNRHNTDRDVFLCHICLSQFGNEELMRNHMSTEHPGFTMCQRCDVCLRAFSSPELLFLHVRQAHSKRSSIHTENVIDKHHINVVEVIKKFTS